MTVSGFTSERKPVVTGVFRLYDTIGLPLNIILDQIILNGWVVDWEVFYNDAMKAGWKKTTFRNRVSEALQDAGQIDAKNRKDILVRLDLLLNHSQQV